MQVLFFSFSRIAFEKKTLSRNASFKVNQSIAWRNPLSVFQKENEFHKTEDSNFPIEKLWHKTLLLTWNSTTLHD